MEGQVHFEEEAAVAKPIGQVLENLADTRCMRAALPNERLSDPRHYGPPAGPGARLAVAIEHVGIKRSGTLTVDAATPTPPEGAVLWHGELPPVQYELTFKARATGPQSTALKLSVVATPQELFFYRIRTRRKVNASLTTEVPEVFTGLVGRVGAYIEDQPNDPRFSPEVTIDGFVEGCPRSDIPPGGALKVEFLQRQVAIFDVDGALYATADECPRGGGRLSEGTLDGHIITCPKHDAAYDIRSGFGAEGTVETVPIYPIRVENDVTWVRIQLV